MKWSGYIIASALALGITAPAAADQRLVVSFHSDAFEVMKEKIPAAEGTLTYWFGAKAARMDIDQRMSAIVRPGKKLYLLNHERRTYSEHELPIVNAAQVVGPELGPVITHWAVPSEAIEDIRPREVRGKYAGYTCRRTEIEISMPLLDYEIDWCDSDQLPIDYGAYLSLLGVRAMLMHGAPWMMAIGQKLGGFPLYSGMLNFGMGNQFRMTEELTSIRKQAAPKGHYDIPAGYRRTRYLELIPQAQVGKK